MVARNSVAVVTPFNGGRHLPSEADLKRIVSRTSEAYCTALHTPATPRRDPAVERKIREVVRARRATIGQPGHVRIRWKVGASGSQPSVEVFNGAYRIESPQAAA